jgi:hypothetical protein
MTLNLGSIGAVLAIVVLVLSIVLVVVGQLPWMLAMLIGLLAVARLT